MIHFKCPNCNSKLVLNDKSYQCINRHSFDCARSGYVNLLNAHNAKQHGDDMAMLKSRRAFLDGDYYRSLMDKLNELMGSETTLDILDAGCGEGWYCENISRQHNVVGIDISKQGCDLSSKRFKGAQFAVASTFDIPLIDESLDVVYSVFAPFSSSEVHRILKASGRFFKVFPLEDHLLSLKRAVYDTAYLNEVSVDEFLGFEYIKQHEVRTTIKIDSHDMIANLFSMTPYVHRTSLHEKQRLSALHSLETEIAFGIHEYRKI